jgi:uncharacterized protein YjbJ (UPF0337 family)
MSQMKKRAEGAVEEVVGAVKKGVGSVVGSERLEAQGRAEELGGRDKQESAKRVERAKGTAEELYGKAKAAVGDAIDDEQIQLEGEATKLKGQARQVANEKAPPPPRT